MPWGSSSFDALFYILLVFKKLVMYQRSNYWRRWMPRISMTNDPTGHLTQVLIVTWFLSHRKWWKIATSSASLLHTYIQACCLFTQTHTTFTTSAREQQLSLTNVISEHSTYSTSAYVNFKRKVRPNKIKK
jgi:hypothetical protein